MKNKYITLALAMVFLISILFADTSFINSVGEASYCCEKTVNGAWCQDAVQTECSSSYRSVPTSCQATSYCKLGTCINSQEGTCMENTPQKTCNDPNGDGSVGGGLWQEGEPEDIPQCRLGCCTIGDQAAFVTQTRCKKLSSLYGLETDYTTAIDNEFSCIASVTSDVKGACVFEKEFEKTCKFITKRECSDIGNGDFHEGFLCSDENLGTNCGPSEQTTCVEGKDEVYFLDTCGNLANIYNSKKQKDKNYWSKIVSGSESCELDKSGVNPSNCGNCDYYGGTTCKAYDKSKGDLVNPEMGNNVCRNLGCQYEGETYQHGETWCADSKGTSVIKVDDEGEITSSKEDFPGGRHFRMVCYNGDVTVEPCADYRQEVCLESSVNDFSTAACRVNRWQDCTGQSEIKDCENTDRRDCEWIRGQNFTGAVSMQEGVCVPKYAPGFNFWEESDAEAQCGLASTRCEVAYEKKLGGDWEVKGDATCLDNDKNIIESWKNQRNGMCIALGDCGSKINYIGKAGYHNESVFKIE